MSFRLVPKLVTLNGIMAVILRYFGEFGSFRDALRKSGTFCDRNVAHLLFVAVRWNRAGHYIFAL